MPLTPSHLHGIPVESLGARPRGFGFFLGPLVVNKHLGQDKLNLNDNIPKLIKEGYIDKELYTNNKTGFENNGSVACFIYFFLSVARLRLGFGPSKG